MADLPSIENFKAAVERAGDLSRGVLYDCQITVSPDIPANTSDPLSIKAITQLVRPDFSQDNLLLCKMVSPPAFQIEATPIKYFGRTINIPSNRPSSIVSLTFYNTYNYDTRNKFIEWINRYNEVIANTRTGPNYYAEIVLTACNLQHEKKAKYEFHSAFPTSVAALEYSYENDSTIQTYAVEFQFLAMEFSRLPEAVTGGRGIPPVTVEDEDI